MINSTSKNLLSFIKNSPSIFHSIASIKKILNREGFIQLKENEEFNLSKGNKYYVIRNESSIIAFKIGEILDNYSFNITSSHCDSPSFKIKPIADINTNKYHKLNVEAYGGMLCSTWFDRPLSIAGRLILKKDNKIISKLVNFDKNVASIPSVAIHFNREANSGYSYNLAVDMVPTISFNKLSFNEMLALQFNEDVNDIVSYDLYLYNRQEGYFWGMEDEFISSSKLDDLQCAYTTLMGFIKSNNKNNVSVYCCFDNEEVGSTTRQGANSTFLEDVLNRISFSLNKDISQHNIALSKSFLISADNAHAQHPNHSEYTDQFNNVNMNDGIVIKYNASQSYTSDGVSGAIFKSICDNANVKTQVFTNKSNIRGGSTLGNISATHVSILSVDIGLAQLAMHSAMETSGTLDNESMVKAIKEFYDSYLTFDENNNYVINKTND